MSFYASLFCFEHIFAWKGFLITVILEVWGCVESEWRKKDKFEIDRLENILAFKVITSENKYKLTSHVD
jgi:hypothetical protein